MKADAAKKAGLVDEVSSALTTPCRPLMARSAAVQIVESEKDLVKRAGVIALEIAAGATPASFRRRAVPAAAR